MRLLLSSALAVSLGCAAPKPAVVSPPPEPPLPALPEAPAAETAETLHGTEVKDPWRWLEPEQEGRVQAWMQAEDTHARAVLSRLPSRERLAVRLKSLLDVDAVSAPVQAGGRLFWMRQQVGKDKAVLYWKDGEAGAEKVLLDPNTWGDGKTTSLGRWVPSHDGRKLVYQEKPNAADEATLKVVEVDTGATLQDVIPGAKYADPSWTPDGQGFYYEWIPPLGTVPVDQRPGFTELRLHVLGQLPEKDAVVHPATKNPSTFLGGGVSRDGRWLFVSVMRGWNENDLYVKDLSAKKNKGFATLALGKGARYEVDVFKDRFYVFTTEGAPRGRVFAVDPKKLARKDWKEVVPEDADGATLDDVSVVGGALALSYLQDAASRLRLVKLDGKPIREVALPTVGTSSSLVGEPDQDVAYFQFTSFTTPKQVYRTEVSTGVTSLWAKVQVPVDTDAFTVEQVQYASKDATKVPMFLVRRKDLPKDGNQPVLLYGYGGFNVSLTPMFNGKIFPWLEAGGIYAVANLRGGGEYGEAWHQAGRGANKQNVFDDFIAAGDHLVSAGWTKPGRIAINGGSNGGLLMGAATTQRPDLWGAVVCAVPLLDMVRYHQFGSGRTWIPEYGSSEDPEQFKTLYGYSPYHRLVAGTAYPPFLMMSSDHDDRVDPLHARKFVAALRAADTTPGDTLLRIEANAGHGGSDQVAKAIEASADMYAFLMARLGLEAK
jgi:prolyl oligopeptidase